MIHGECLLWWSCYLLNCLASMPILIHWWESSKTFSWYVFWNLSFILSFLKSYLLSTVYCCYVRGAAVLVELLHLFSCLTSFRRLILSSTVTGSITCPCDRPSLADKTRCQMASFPNWKENEEETQDSNLSATSSECGRYIWHLTRSLYK